MRIDAARCVLWALCWLLPSLSAEARPAGAVTFDLGAGTNPVGIALGGDGNLWIALMYQTGIARFDRKTESFKIWPLPAEWQTDSGQQSFVSPYSAAVDGKVTPATLAARSRSGRSSIAGAPWMDYPVRRGRCGDRADPRRAARGPARGIR